MTKQKKTAAFETVKLCCRALDEKKAEELRVFDVTAQSSITDYLVIATATSEPHLRALRIELEKALDSSGTRIVGIETARESGWVVVDAFDVMVHLFLGPMREHYGLERLWSDATEVSVARILAPEPAKPAAKRGKRTVKTSGAEKPVRKSARRKSA